jgi:leader peptidase (prepilin peptidase)/N-methyltransferase
VFFYIFFVGLILAAISCVLAISVADFRRRIIPDVYLFPLLLIGLCMVVFCPYPVSVPDAVVGAVFGYIMSAGVGLVFEYLMRKRVDMEFPPIGMGDVKLMAVGGLWLGTTALAVALILAGVFGGLWAHIKHQRYIPFAPFFFVGGFLSFVICYFLI